MGAVSPKSHPKALEVLYEQLRFVIGHIEQRLKRLLKGLPNGFEGPFKVHPKAS